MGVRGSRREQEGARGSKGAGEGSSGRDLLHRLVHGGSGVHPIP